METWKPVLGYEGTYEISDHGNLRSVTREVPHARFGTAVINGKDIKLKTHKDGYWVATLHKDGARKNRMAHVLVLEAFVGPRPEGMETRHLDGNPKNNRLENICWGTPVENAADKKRHGTEPWSARTHCKHGHEFTEENTGRGPGGSRRCRECERIKDRRLYAKAKANGAHPNIVNGEKTHCKHGHEFTPENTRMERNGTKRACRTCGKLREQARRARVKASK